MTKRISQDQVDAFNGFKAYVTPAQPTKAEIAAVAKNIKATAPKGVFSASDIRDLARDIIVNNRHQQARLDQDS